MIDLSIKNLKKEAFLYETMTEYKSMNSLLYLLKRGANNLFEPEIILLKYFKKNYIDFFFETNELAPFDTILLKADNEMNQILENKTVNPGKTLNLIQKVEELIQTDNKRLIEYYKSKPAIKW